MDETLHPSTLGEILDRTAQLYRARFLVFLGIAFIPTATLLVFAGGVALFAAHAGSGNGGDIFAGLAIVGLVLVGLPVLLATTALATAALVHAAARTVFAQPITIRGSYRAVWPHGWRYIGLLAIQFAAVWVVPVLAWTFLVMIAAGLAAIAGGSGGGLVAFAIILVILGLVAYGFWMALRLSLAFPASVVEQSGAWAALKRSWTLGSGSRGRILVLYLLGNALNSILSIAVWVPLLVILYLIPGANSQQHQQVVGTVSLLIVYGAGFAVQAFTRPVYGIALMLFYYDQRIRREGFDIEWMMQKAGLVVPPVVPPFVTEVVPLADPLPLPPAPEETAQPALMAADAEPEPVPDAALSAPPGQSPAAFADEETGDSTVPSEALPSPVAVPEPVLAAPVPPLPQPGDQP